MNYCRKCVMPDTKPYVEFDADGVCNACRAHQRKSERQGGIDWSARQEQFDQLIEDVKSANAPLYDVLVPVSGGKDSLAQVHRLLPYDLRIVAVNVDYGIKTELGRYNLELVPEMGANLITYRPEQDFHRRLIRIGFEDFGDPDLLSHTLLHAYPLHAAMALGVPLVLLGENSAFEYGGDRDIAERKGMGRDWFSKYAANAGHDARFVSGKYGIPMLRLAPYDFPDGLEASDTQAVFMSYYFPWDSAAHLNIALQHGFRTLAGPAEGTYRNYVGLDEKINRVHQYMKVLKFGYGRATDHACEDIRNGRLTRDEAKALVRRHDLQGLSDDYVDEFAAHLGMAGEAVLAVLEKYRNQAIWRHGDRGEWCIKGHLQDGQPAAVGQVTGSGPAWT